MTKTAFLLTLMLLAHALPLCAQEQTTGTAVVTTATVVATAAPATTETVAAATEKPPAESGTEDILLLTTATESFLSMTTESYLIPPYSTESVLLDFAATTVTAEEKFVLPESALPPAELQTLLGKSDRSRPVSAMGAVCRALAVNQALRIQLISPEISNTGIEGALAEFDTVLNLSASMRAAQSSTLGPRPLEDDGSERIEETRRSRNSDVAASLGGRLPTGTDYSLSLDLNKSKSDSTHPFFSGSANLRITQNLLRNAGYEINMIRVWTAKNNFVSSLYNLQSALINLVTDVQNAYWDLYLAGRSLEIRQKSYEVAKDRVRENAELVRVGRATQLDYLSAQAEEAARVSDIINAAATVKRQAVEFARLLNPDASPNGWDQLFHPSEVPETRGEPLRTEERIRLAKYYRPDLRQAYIDLANGELAVIETANGLLPALDFIVEGGLSGSGDDTGDVSRKILDGDFPNWRLGLEFSVPLQNRAARSSHRRAQFQRQQAEESVKNFEQLIETDIRLAIIEIERATRLIESTRITRRLREKELEAEVEKFRVGRSTQLLINQAQRDLTSAALDEVTAEVANIKSYLSLYRVEGTALQRVGVAPVMITPESGVP